MPWIPKQFQQKPAKHLTDTQAKKASEMANAMLKNDSDEGIAIATAIKRSKMSKAKKRFDKL